MAICGTCGADATRVRTVFEVNGKQLPLPKDHCRHCDPSMEFEPDWARAKPAMGWEAYPNQYRRVEDPEGGWKYIATDESRSDQEAQLSKPSEDETARYQAAVEAKRRLHAERKNQQLTGEQQQSIINRWRPLLEDAEADKQRVVEDAVRQLYSPNV